MGTLNNMGTTCNSAQTCTFSGGLGESEPGSPTMTDIPVWDRKRIDICRTHRYAEELS